MIWQERILAFVQIFFESFPLSSSAQVLVAKNLLGRILGQMPKISGQSFFLWHIPSLFVFCGFALIIFYREFLKQQIDQRSKFLWQVFRSIGLLGLSCVPTAALYGAKIGKFGCPNLPMLFPGFVISVFFLVAIKFTRATKEHWPLLQTYDSVFIGFAQAIALVPGVSRMACTTAGFFF